MQFSFPGLCMQLTSALPRKASAELLEERLDSCFRSAQGCPAQHCWLPSSKVTPGFSQAPRRNNTLRTVLVEKCSTRSQREKFFTNAWIKLSKRQSLLAAADSSERLASQKLQLRDGARVFQI